MLHNLHFLVKIERIRPGAYVNVSMFLKDLSDKTGDAHIVLGYKKKLKAITCGDDGSLMDTTVLKNLAKYGRYFIAGKRDLLALIYTGSGMICSVKPQVCTRFHNHQSPT